MMSLFVIKQNYKETFRYQKFILFIWEIAIFNKNKNDIKIYFIGTQKTYKVGEIRFLGLLSKHDLLSGIKSSRGNYLTKIQRSLFIIYDFSKKEEEF